MNARMNILATVLYFVSFEAVFTESSLEARYTGDADFYGNGYQWINGEVQSGSGSGQDNSGYGLLQSKPVTTEWHKFSGEADDYSLTTPQQHWTNTGQNDGESGSGREYSGLPGNHIIQPSPVETKWHQTEEASGYADAGQSFLDYISQYQWSSTERDQSGSGSGQIYSKLPDYPPLINTSETEWRQSGSRDDQEAFGGQSSNHNGLQMMNQGRMISDSQRGGSLNFVNAPQNYVIQTAMPFWSMVDPIMIHGIDPIYAPLPQLTDMELVMWNEVERSVDNTTWQENTTIFSAVTGSPEYQETEDEEEYVTLFVMRNVTTVIDNVTYVKNNVTLVYRMCGYPITMSQNACKMLNTSTDPLIQCNRPGIQAAFTLTIIILAVLIVAGNCLLPLAVWHNQELRTHHNILKVSLAVSDLIVGLVLLFSVLPNMIWTLNSTENGIIDTIRSTENSFQSVLIGGLITLSAQTSLLHLMYLSIERYIAIQWPFWHRQRRTKSIVFHICLLWLLSMLSCYLPVIFNEHFSYEYSPLLFLHILTIKKATNYIHGTVYLIVVMVVPFLITMTFTIITAFSVWSKLRSTAHMKRFSNRKSKTSQSSSGNQTMAGNGARESRGNARVRPEVQVFQTTVIMIAGFCLTLVPFVVVTILFYEKYYDCSNYSVPFASSFYACLSCSFVNVVIYSARDAKFRREMKTIMQEWRAKTTRQLSSSFC